MKDVVEYVAGGMPESELLADFPSLTEADVRAALDFDRRTTSDERERS